ncbi:1-acyl-sn-glycerol-3-phosphate acyltransferase [Thermoleptolyngbya sp. PKUAC-SCTB121]|uniref:lysophospholipid acyltransferase family protein n=1 Tax=Thermoleptolyngbya sp. PKUAC-SCTB121 TaxID=2811482 RepID=UPI001962A56D
MVLHRPTDDPLTASVTNRESKVNSKVSPWLSAIAYPLGNRLLLPAYFGKIEIHGQHHLPAEGPVILAPLHRARWDALLVPHATGPSVTGRLPRFMVTADEVKGLQGWFIRRLGGFPVNPRQPGVASLRFGLELLQQGEMLVIFPEGGIFRDRLVHSLKPGLARLALQAEHSQPGLGLQVVPIHLHYDEPLPRWGCQVSINIGAPIRVEPYLQEPPKQGAKRLTADLRHALERLSPSPETRSLIATHKSEMAA